MTYLDAASSGSVSQAVVAAEKLTSGEIVTVLADRSDGYSDIALAWASLAAFTVMSVFAVVPDALIGFLNLVAGGWYGDWMTGQLFSALIAAGLLSFFAVWAIQRWDGVRFALIPAPVKTARAHERAIEHFKVGAERRTHGRTGILIYLSMREHRAEIVADQAIASVVDAEIWGEAMAAMLAELKQGRIAEGMVAAVEQVGIVLAQHFPREDDDVNELPDRLIEL